MCWGPTQQAGFRAYRRTGESLFAVARTLNREFGGSVSEVAHLALAFIRDERDFNLAAALCGQAGEPGAYRAAIRVS